MQLNDRKLNYIKNIDLINSAICEFNNFFSQNNSVPVIDKSKLDNNSYFTSLSNCSWKELTFPNAGQRGVYFIFGFNEELQCVSLYIGKASFASTIGNRLYAHLIKDSNNDKFYMNDVVGNGHVLEYALSIDLDSCAMHWFSSALEEYLIAKTKDDIYLLNGTGNFK